MTDQRPIPSGRPTDERPVPSGLRRNRPALVIAGAVLFGLLVVVEALTAGAWFQIRGTTETFGTSVHQVANLANVQRDLLRLSSQVQQLAHDPGVRDDVDISRALLANQLRLLKIKVASQSDFAAELERVDLHLIAVDHLVSRVGPGDILSVDGAATAAEEFHLSASLVQRRYDSLEQEYFEGVEDALRDRNSTLGLLGGVALGLAAFGAFYVYSIHRATREDFGEAFARLADSESRYRTVVESVRDVVFTTDAMGRFQFLSGVWTSLTGYSVEESIGRPFLDFVHPEQRPSCQQKFAEFAASSAEESTHEVPYVKRDGSSVWVEVWVRKNGAGTSGRIVDNTERRRTARKLQQLALHDPLTGLANRNLLGEHLSTCLARRARSGNSIALLFCDLDRFKFVNDSLGHDVGDDLLISVAKRISSLLRPSDVAARLGGDEFVVVLDELDASPALAMAQARQISSRIEEAISKPHDLQGRPIVVTASVGITLAEDTDRPDEMLAQADAAMYHAKGRGKGRHEVYDSAMQLAAADRLATEHDLRVAVDRGELRLFYQPVIDSNSGEPVGLEALLRWEHPHRGLLSPAVFLGVAEEAGLMPQIGEWVIREACQRLRGWLDMELTDPSFSVAVNLSARQLDMPNIVPVVIDALNRNRLQPSNLTVEITEDQMVGAHPHAVEALRRIRGLGVQVAMDDFGTGYSSLSYLRQLPIDVLKIDRAFVSRIGLSDDDTTIVEAVIRLGNALGLTTTAEGVELPSQIRLLREFGCDRLQGYLLGRPVPPEQVVDCFPGAPEDDGFEPAGVGDLADRAETAGLFGAVSSPRDRA